ncbi:MAG TPA: AIR synthase related protein [Thermoleophilia bacterium]|nr:AIR synthase related protein [Thermoleophilia bacterium]
MGAESAPDGLLMGGSSFETVLAHAAGEGLLREVRSSLVASAGLARKREIGQAVRALAGGYFPLDWPPCFGEDAAAIPHGDGYLLLAADGIRQDLLTDPFWAGYCSVLVNVNDVVGTGGRPLAMVNVVSGADAGRREELLSGVAFGSRHFGVPMIGGHLHPEGTEESVAVAIVGTARSLVSSFAARPGDELVVAVDTQGSWHGAFPHWDSTSQRSPEELQAQLSVLPRLCEGGRVLAGKDISNPGLLGTLLMLLESSGVGAVVDLERVPAPPGVPLVSWLEAYPGLGFVLAVSPDRSGEVIEAFSAAGMAAAVAGGFTAGSVLAARCAGSESPLWDHSITPVTGVATTMETF